MSNPYGEGRLSKPPIVEKLPVCGRIVCVLHSQLQDRGLELMHTMTRAVAVSEVQELLVTDEASRGPGSRVDRIAYLGFFELETSGLLAVGDVVSVGRWVLGRIVGFDATHAPNHLNIVVGSDQLQDGRELGLAVGDLVTISFAGEDDVDHEAQV